MFGREKNLGKNSSDSSATPLRTGMFRSRPFSDPTVSDEVSPHKQELPDLQTQLERGARFSQSLSRMKVYGNRPAIQPKISVGAPGDKYEQEADQMAQQVMSMPAAVTHPPIQRLEKQEEEKEPVQTKPLAASITPLVQRETAPEELEEDKQPVQTKRSLQETAEVSIQRDGTEALPAVPNYQLTPPSLLQPPDPSSRYGLGQNFQLHLDPQIQAMAFQHVQQQMEPATIRAALSQVNLGLTALPAPSASGPTATPTPNPFATPSPSPAAPLVPRGAGPDTPRPATAGDLMSALLAVPAIDTWITTLQTRATEQMMRDWRRLSTGEQVGAVSSAVAIGAGALAGILSDPNARQMALSQLNGRVFPVPGLNWLSLEINTGGNNLMLGGHVDIGNLLPPSLGFGSSSAQPIGGPPTPQPFVPGQPSVQREVTPEAEEEKVQMKPLANAMIQREAMPEEKEKVQTKPLLQRASEGGRFQASSDIESQLSTSKGGGSSLPDEVRSFMEPRIGADFGSVRVHTDSEAVQMNQDLNAQAFTHGSDIYFGAGKYSPNSSDGKRLLAHELTHVVQQTGQLGRKVNQIQRDGGTTNEKESTQQQEDPKEKEFRQKAEAALKALGDKPGATTNGGDGVVTNISGFPDWFGSIQNKLIVSQVWGKPQEEAQNLLHDYAVWYFSEKKGKKHLPPSLEHFFRYLGRSAANEKANTTYNQKEGKSTPHAGELGAGQGYNWCAAATSGIFKQALVEKGLRIKEGFTQSWFNKTKLQINAPQVHTIDLRPGDQVSYVDMNTPPSGHVVTVVEASGDTFTTVSGNAGGVKGGSVRLGQVTRETPPPNYNYWQAIKDNNPTYKGPLKPSKAGIVWIATIIRLSDIDPSQINPDDQSVLKEYGLERIDKVKK